MRRIWLVCLGLTGCQQLLGLDAPVLAPDAPAPDSNEVCVGGGLATYCVPANAVPTNAFDITPGNTFTLDPTSSQLCMRTQLAGVEACVVAAATSSIAGTLNAVGPYPLVIAVFDVITVNGTIDVSSTISGSTSANEKIVVGAGSGPASCPTLDGTSNLLSGGTGGGGGSFGISGGAGGGITSMMTGANAGTVRAIELAGGCPGGKGGSGNDGPAGVAGLGGGAVYIIARNSITVNGTIKANGAGGGGGGKRAGGGAGGSGGLIAFDAPTVRLGASAAIYANGGGGGEGGDSSSPGADGSTSAGPLDRALGGTTGSQKGGSGGGGSLDSSAGQPGGNSMDTSGGGGGGGGGGGIIAVYSNSLSNQAVVSPPLR